MLQAHRTHTAGHNHIVLQTVASRSCHTKRNTYIHARSCSLQIRNWPSQQRFKGIDGTEYNAFLWNDSRLVSDRLQIRNGSTCVWRHSYPHATRYEWFCYVRGHGQKFHLESSSGPILYFSLSAEQLPSRRWLQLPSSAASVCAQITRDVCDGGVSSEANNCRQ